jgi:hypothetical protein
MDEFTPHYMYHSGSDSEDRESGDRKSDDRESDDRESDSDSGATRQQHTRRDSNLTERRSISTCNTISHTWTTIRVARDVGTRRAMAGRQRGQERCKP